MIREYHDSDWSEICRVFDLSYPHELAADGLGKTFMRLVDNGPFISDFVKSTIFVWEENGRLRGFSGYRANYIGWLYVEPSAFRQGIARALLRHVLERTGGNPWLWVMKNNRSATSLYRSEGFEIMEAREIPIGGVPCIGLKLVRKSSPTSPALSGGSSLGGAVPAGKMETG